MKRKICSLILGALCAVSLVGCGLGEEKEAADTGQKKIALTVWGAKEDEELMGQIIQSFEKQY